MPNTLMTREEVGRSLREAVERIADEYEIDQQTAAVVFMGAINGYTVLADPKGYKEALAKFIEAAKRRELRA